MGVSTPRRPPVPYRPPQTDRLEPTLSPAAVLPSGSTRGPCRAPHCRFRPPTAARASTPRRPPALYPTHNLSLPLPGEARWGSPLRDSPRPLPTTSNRPPRAHPLPSRDAALGLDPRAIPSTPLPVPPADSAPRIHPDTRPSALTPRTLCPSPYQGEARWGSPLRDGPSPYRPPQTDSPQAHLSPTATLPLDSTRGPPSTRHMPILGSPPPLETGAPFNRGMRTRSSTPPKKTKEPPHCCDGSSARKRS